MILEGSRRISILADLGLKVVVLLLQQFELGTSFLDCRLLLLVGCYVTLLFVEGFDFSLKAGDAALRSFESIGELALQLRANLEHHLIFLAGHTIPPFLFSVSSCAGSSTAHGVHSLP